MEMSGTRRHAQPARLLDYEPRCAWREKEVFIAVAAHHGHSIRSRGFKFRRFEVVLPVLPREDKLISICALADGERIARDIDGRTRCRRRPHFLVKFKIADRSYLTA